MYFVKALKRLISISIYIKSHKLNYCLLNENKIEFNLYFNAIIDCMVVYYKQHLVNRVYNQNT